VSNFTPAQKKKSRNQRGKSERKCNKMKGSNDFPVKKEKSILLLIAGLSLDAVAKKLKISPVTLWRWQQEDLYVARYRHLRRVRVEHSIAALQSLTNDAVECLRRNLSSGSPPSEVRSALGILTKSFEAVDLLEMETRVSEVEKRLEIAK
jgi:AraC-like DNA-binding protein